MEGNCSIYPKHGLSYATSFLHHAMKVCIWCTYGRVLAPHTIRCMNCVQISDPPSEAIHIDIVMDTHGGGGL